MSDLDNEGLADDSETDTESMDPFPDRRLSEVVAQMLDSDAEYDDRDIQTEYDPFEDQYEIKTAFIDYNEEPKNKELFRGPLPSIEESDLEDAFACEYETCPYETDKLKPVDNQKELNDESSLNQIESVSDSFSQNNRTYQDQHIKTVIGKSTETIFGVSLPQENEEAEGRIKCRCETEFGVETEIEDLRYCWSVTSV